MAAASTNIPPQKPPAHPPAASSKTAPHKTNEKIQGLWVNTTSFFPAYPALRLDRISHTPLNFGIDAINKNRQGIVSSNSPSTAGSQSSATSGSQLSDRQGIVSTHSPGTGGSQSSSTSGSQSSDSCPGTPTPTSSSQESAAGAATVSAPIPIKPKYPFNFARALQSSQGHTPPQF